jgi:hypothetical protein
LTACNNTEPEIQVSKIISNVTSEKFNDLGGKIEYEESNQKDCKKLTFNFSMENEEWRMGKKKNCNGIGG